MLEELTIERRRKRKRNDVVVVVFVFRHCVSLRKISNLRMMK